MEGKVEFSVGPITLSGSGEQEWLEKQLIRILEAAPGLIDVAQPAPDASGSGGAGGVSRSGVTASATGTSFSDTLVSYIKGKNGEDNQVQRFLATADWLRRRGVTKLTTAAVSKALRDNHQKRLGNPSDCLNQNVSKGFCEKTGDSFFITPDGLAALGHK
jgi:hypothetical protein